MAEKIFCKYHLYAKYKHPNSILMINCSPKDPDMKLTCGAHLNEARAFPCSYKPEEIYEDNRRKRIIIAHRNEEGKIISICEDFNPITQAETSA